MVELEKKAKEIDNLVEEKYKNIKDYVILDGIVDIEKYLSAKFKILWILKEPHDKGEHGKWDMRDLLKNYAKKSNKLNPNMVGTFTKIIYPTYSILNNFIAWDKMDYINENPNMIDILQSIAIINIKKLPGNASSSENEIQEAYKKYNSIILKQIEDYNPNIIIGGGTIQHLYTDLKLSKLDKKTLPKLENITKHPKVYYVSDEKIIIETCHPAAIVNQEQYCTNIINAVKEWSEKKK